MREAADVKMQLLVSDCANVARLTLENQGGLVFASRAEVAVEAIFGDIQLAAHKPLGMRGFPLENLPEGLAPDDMLFGLFGPKFVWSVDRLGVEPTVNREAAKVCLALELG
jgi:hypothetical protein